MVSGLPNADVEILLQGLDNIHSFEDLARGVTFDCMTAVEVFVREHTLEASQPLLMTAKGQIEWRDVRRIFKVVAQENGLDPKRLIPRILRSGAVNQLDAANHTSETLERQGGWTSKGGMQSYLRSDFRHAELVTNTLHDENAIPIAHTRHMFSAGGIVSDAFGGTPAASSDLG